MSSKIGLKISYKGSSIKNESVQREGGGLVNLTKGTRRGGTRGGGMHGVCVWGIACFIDIKWNDIKKIF